MMLRRFFNSQTLNRRWLSARPMVQLDEAVNKKFEDEELHPKRHPGIVKSRTIKIPEWVESGILDVTKDKSVKTLCQDGEKLAAHLNQRHPPPDENDVRSKVMEVKELFAKKVDFSKLTHEETTEFWKRNSFNFQNAVKQRIYSWAPVDYDEYKSLLYLFARGVQDYSVLHQIFNEISQRDPNFKPKSLFDFGSGIGTVVWAASHFWQESLDEYYCVDSSANMGNLAEAIIGNRSPKIKGIYYRQFLPASSRKTSDIVVSAFSLFEIANTQARLEVMLNLWSKTNQYLVIVEQGTNAGFKLVNEARDFILEISSKTLETETPNPCHVFAPCPHDSICPRYMTDRTPCNFQTSYFPLNFGSRTPEPKKERYSYVVLKKGERSEDDQQWPRIVRPTLIRSKHTICRMCTAAGKLDEMIFTAAKHGKYAYRCARYSNWGDKLPIRIVDPPQTDDPQ